MATSRYDTNQSVGGTKVGATDSNVTSGENSSGSTSGSTTGNSSSTTTNNSNTKTNSVTNNMSPQAQAALNLLIKQLMSGGTPEIQQQRAVRDNERNTVEGIRQGYSKEAAFGDAQGLIAQQMRRALESMLPSINRAAEDAGSSGGALRALLLQDSANKAAESSSALGVQTAVQYGGISSNLSQVLEQLTRIDPASTTALLNALNVAKGAVSTTNSNSSTTGTQTTVGQTAGTTQGTTNNQGNKSVNTDYAPFANPVASSNTPIYFGPSDTSAATNYAGSTAHTLSQLFDPNPWNGYEI